MFKTTGLHEKVYDHLKQLIYDNAFSTQDPVFETQLAEQLGVSRTPVREAIHLLKNEGLLEPVAGGGVRALLVTSQDLHDAFEVRIAHETVTVKLATQRMNQERQSQLKSILEKTEVYLTQGLLGETLKENENFHRLIASIAQSRLIEQILDRIYDHLKLHRWQKLVTGESDVLDRVKLSHQEHVSIAEAMMQGDAEQAQTLMYQHLSNNKTYLQEKLPFND